ncbi:tyrosine-type recombinase/integrase [Pseudomonas borbori]|uniref:Site-specific recombinase XerD n=1 Tax=Pseudomonas borbori TaxID=289003 RepID=A0A1I5XJ63_9PSED|nr:tyrosine-type recombinase/integrase [Pseudomonas borbori]SFQ31990.1 Site-specific recombinase XerD [Pseudomonas borbori]
MSTMVTVAELAQDAQEFLRFKRAMGMTYRRGEFALKSFVRFVGLLGAEDDAVALDEAVIGWITRVEGRKAVTVGYEFGVVRQLCLFRRRRDPSSYVPEHALAPVKESVFVPYIFTHDEVRRLLAAAQTLDGRFIWGTMLRCLMLVLYCTGMRLGEAVRLSMDDIDLDQGVLMVRNSKRRSRLVPIRDDLVNELRRYAQARQWLIDANRRAAPVAFFLRKNVSPLTVRSASDALRRLLREHGLKPPCGRVGARPYEFRHAFAVHRLTAWALDGVDVHARLPWLSAYLGHQNVLGTEVYLKATPQLLALASDRFETHLRHARRPR